MKNKSFKRVYGLARGYKRSILFLALVQSLSSVCTVFTAMLAKSLVDMAAAGSIKGVKKYAVILSSIFLLNLMLWLISADFTVRLRGKINMRLRSRFFVGALQKDYMSIEAYHSGDILTRLSSDADIASNGLSGLVPSAAALFTKLLCSVWALLVLDKFFALALFLISGVIFVFAVIFRKKFKKLHKKVQKTEGRVRAFMQEALEHIPVVKIFDLSERLGKKTKTLQLENYGAKIKKNQFSIIANLGFTAASGFSYVLALVWSGVKLARGTFPFGSLTATVQLVSLLRGTAFGASGLVPQYYQMIASAERLFEIEDLQDDFSEEKKNAAELYSALKCIRFSSVDFSYDKIKVFENAGVEIQKNDTVAITGSSGIGKSTFFKLLTGLVKPSVGRVSLETAEQSFDMDPSFRSLFAYVPQGNMLMSGTIRENLTLVNAAATDEEINAAVECAVATDFINELPDGLDTVLSENGMGLSEGQVQRLAVARALLSNAPVLLFDEATSALDEKTERELLSNISALKNRTLIIISHKVQALSVCSKRMIIEDGKIILDKLV